MPLRRDHRPLPSLADVGRALNGDCTVLDIEDVVDDYADGDGDVNIDDLDSEGFEICVHRVGVRLDYPFTISHMWAVFDDIIADRDALDAAQEAIEEDAGQ